MFTVQFQLSFQAPRLDPRLQFGARRRAEVVKLCCKSQVPRAHTDSEGFGVRLFGVPALNRHAVEGSYRARPVCAAAAMEEDRIIGGIVDNFKVFCDCSFVNSTRWPNVLQRNADIIQALPPD